MGRKTACSADQWRELTRELARTLARKLRKEKGGKIGFDEWRRYFAEALRKASQLAIDDCDVRNIVNRVVAEF